MNLKRKLKNGAIIECRNKDIYIKINKWLVNTKGTKLSIKYYTKDLLWDNIDNDFTIMKFSNNKIYAFFSNLSWDWDWVRDV